MKEFASGTVSVSDRCPKRLLEVSRRAFASSREVQSGQKWDQYWSNLSSRQAKKGLNVVKSDLIRRISCFLVREVHVGSFFISAALVREGIESECAATLRNGRFRICVMDDSGLGVS